MTRIHPAILAFRFEIFIPPTYTNRSGKYVFENGFPEGLVALEKNGKWGFLDLKGKKALEMKYDEAANFSNGMAKVKMGGKCGYIIIREKNWCLLDMTISQTFQRGLPLHLSMEKGESSMKEENR